MSAIDGGLILDARCAGWLPSVLLPPAVSEACVVLDLVEGRVEGAELVPDTLDYGADIRPVTVNPASSDEPFMAQPIIDGAVGHEVAGF